LHRFVRATRSPLVVSGALLAGLLATAGTPAALAAQTSPFDTAAALPRTSPAPVPPSGAVLLDAPVNRAEYRLGPGDGVDVAVFGDFNDVVSATVSPEGSLLLPGMGIVHVLDLNLNEAEARVRALVRRFYRNVDARLALSRVRTFKVYVVGDVPAPGMRIATAATRVSEVLEDTVALAHPDRDRGRPEDDAMSARVRQRNVVIRRASGDTLVADLVRFRQTGDRSANPTLREGDAVVVPAVDQRVDLYGRVHFPGRYQYRPGETLAELLYVANGGAGFPADAADTLRVVRFLDAQRRETFAFSRTDAAAGAGRGFVLQPFDAVYLPRRSNFMVQRTASIRGEVARPGEYPIRPDTTTLGDLVALAGGFTPEASLVDAQLRRPGEDSNAFAELERVPEELLTPEDRRILRARTAAPPDQVVVDFRRLFAEGGSAFDVPLRAGDVLTIPERRTTVSVLGAVHTPGQVSHAYGLSPYDFVSHAGGFTRRADRGRAVVLSARTGARVSLSEVQAMEPGDVLVVPFRTERNLLSSLQAVQAVVGTVTGIVFLVLTLR
jgi:polysaccharide biosynthesis/export protein